MLSRLFIQHLAPSRFPKCRSIASTELQTKDEYVIKVEVDPFTTKDLEVCLLSPGLVQVKGYREELTGINNWKHSMELKFTIPPTVQQDSVQACYNEGVLEIKGVLTKQLSQSSEAMCPAVKDCNTRK